MQRMVNVNIAAGLVCPKCGYPVAYIGEWRNDHNSPDGRSFRRKPFYREEDAYVIHCTNKACSWQGNTSAAVEHDLTDGELLKMRMFSIYYYTTIDELNDARSAIGLEPLEIPEPLRIFFGLGSQNKRASDVQATTNRQTNDGRPTHNRIVNVEKRCMCQRCRGNATFTQELEGGRTVIHCPNCGDYEYTTNAQRSAS